MNRVLVLLVVFGLCIGTSNAFGQNKVIIYNLLGHNKVLRVHCKSGDDNLGYHYLRPGQSYDFSFGDNIFMTTLFWCQFRQGPHWKYHKAFVAYESGWDSRPGVKYKWVANDNGIYFTLDARTPEKKYGWELPPEDEKLPPDAR